MKDFPMFTTEYGVASLLMKEIPYKETAYIIIQSSQEPEELPAQWRFVWSTDPAKAQPFLALSTSPYNTGDCCTENGIVYRSKVDGNVWAPSAYMAAWEMV